MREKWTTGVALVLAVATGLALALTATACGSSSEQMGGGNPSATTTAELVTPPQPYGEVLGGRVLINIAGLEFEPDILTVPEGTTAIFTNNDKVPHSVTKMSGPGNDFDSGPIQPGGTYQQILRDRGTIKIEDTENDGPELTIEVEEK